MAGSGKFEETTGPNTEPKGPLASDTTSGFATGCAEFESVERMTVLSGVMGPSCDTAEEASRYVGMATMIKIILARNEK